MALNQTVGILRRARPALEQEDDFDLARASLSGSLKLLEGLLQSGPNNRDLLELVAMSYFSYAVIDLEDHLDQAQPFSDTAETLAARAKKMHLRAHGFGLRLLEVDHPGFTAILKGDPKRLEAELKRMKAKDVPGLFWTGLPLLASMAIGPKDINTLLMLSKATTVVQRVDELDEGYFHGAASMALGAMYGSLAEVLGGNPKRARGYFDRALTLTQRRFLMIQVTMAQTLAVQTEDRALFMALLNEVTAADLSVFPEQKLANLAAKRRALRWRARVDTLF